MLAAFWMALFAVVLAEMGDKTQLLAMAFAMRFRWQTVLAAVAAATLLNHFLAVVAGNVITNVVPIVWVKLLAAVSFLLFALWTLHDDASPDSAQRSSRSPFMTVAIAFFIAEMGDKTQLMTITLVAGQAAEAGGSGLAAALRQVMPVWMGSTAGMIIADGVGIMAGIILHKRIPLRPVKWLAAATFAAFGILGIHAGLDQLLPEGIAIHHGCLLGLVPVMALLMIMIARRNARRTGTTAR